MSSDYSRSEGHQQQQLQVGEVHKNGMFKGIGRVLFGEDTEEQEERIKRTSPYGHFSSWRLLHIIVKVR